MNKENVQELMMGAAVVALGYALWTRFKPGASKGKPAAPTFQLPPFQATSAINPNVGVTYDPANPGFFTGLTNLINGAVHDIYTGDQAGESIPSVGDIFKSVNGDIPYYSELRGDIGINSIVRIDDGEWWQQ